MIQTMDLTKTYRLGDTNVLALQRVDLVVERGEFLAIAGPSGSGKSTLLSLIGCLEQPTHGKIFLEKVDVTLLSSNERAEIRARKLGFIFQTFNLLPVLTAYENIEYPLCLHQMPESLRHDRVLQLLRDVGLESHAQHRPAQLSGGQRQRVAIARALAASPSVILADEPTANLDQATGLEILSLLRVLNQKTGITLVFSTHDPRIIAQADRIVRLESGRLT